MNNKISLITNLCYIIKEDKVLLQKKARGFGLGKWNAPGGKVKNGETIINSAIREVREETGLTVYNLVEIGYHDFIFENKNEWNNRCYIFTTKDFKGIPENLGEGELKWYHIDKLPIEEMWDDDKYWAEQMLKGNFESYTFYFDKEGKYLKHKKIINT